MKWIFGLIVAALAYWWFFLREKPECGCGQHKKATTTQEKGGCGCNQTQTSAPDTQMAVFQPMLGAKSYFEPASQPNGELEYTANSATYKSIFGDEGNAGEEETYE